LPRCSGPAPLCCDGNRDIRVRDWTDQLQTHGLAWLGAVVLLVTGAIGVRKPLYRSPGLVVVFMSASLYAAVAVWHFWLHSSAAIQTFPTCCWRCHASAYTQGRAMVAVGMMIPRCRVRYVEGRARFFGVELCGLKGIRDSRRASSVGQQLGQLAVGSEELRPPLGDQLRGVAVAGVEVAAVVLKELARGARGGER
jgi:hypothetical protein